VGGVPNAQVVYSRFGRVHACDRFSCVCILIGGCVGVRLRETEIDWAKMRQTEKVWEKTREAERDWENTRETRVPMQAESARFGARRDLTAQMNLREAFVPRGGAVFLSADYVQVGFF
jgi:hypothetical protein